MAQVSLVFNKGKEWLAKNDFTSASNLKVMLLGAGYAPDVDDDFIGSGAGTPGDSELSGTGYEAGFGNSGRKALASRTAVENDTDNRADLGAANIVWEGIDAGDIKAVALVQEVSNDGLSPLIAIWYDDGGATLLSTNGGDVTLTLGTSGVLRIT